MTKPAVSLSSSPGLVLPPSPSVLASAPLTPSLARGLSASASLPFLAATFLAALFFAAAFLVPALGAVTSGSAAAATLVVWEGTALAGFAVPALVSAGSVVSLAEVFLAAAARAGFAAALFAGSTTGSVFAAAFLAGAALDVAVLAVLATGMASAFTFFAAVLFVAGAVGVEREAVAATARCAVAASRVT